MVEGRGRGESEREERKVEHATKHRIITCNLWPKNPLMHACLASHLLPGNHLITIQRLSSACDISPTLYSLSSPYYKAAELQF